MGWKRRILIAASCVAVLTVSAGTWVIVANADRDGFYRPIWESFAAAGYASLAWDKPGIGGAAGNWLDQSMHDRATETEAALVWARKRPEIDANRIGLWGISQAGWVLPEVAVRHPELRFMENYRADVIETLAPGYLDALRRYAEQSPNQRSTS